MSDTERITVGETTDGEAFSLPVIDVLTGRGFATGKSGAGKSVLEGTMVYTDDGRKAIENVESGEKVLSLNKRTYEQEYREVQATIEHASDELLRITLEDGTELVGTEDHSFLTVEDLEIVPIRGENLEEGTWLPLSRELPSPETTTRVDLADYVEESRDLDINDDDIRSGQKVDDRYINLDFSAGKTIGLFLAEGSFDSHLTVQVSNVDDDVQEFLSKNGFNVYNRTCNRSFKPFGRFLESEFGRGAAGKSIPNWVYETPNEFRAGMVSGYIDGDGTVEEDTVVATSKSPELVEGIAELLRQFGISSTIREKMVLYEGQERSFRRLRIDSFCTDKLDRVVDLSIQKKASELETIAHDSGDEYNTKDMLPSFGDVLNTAAREREWTTRESDRRAGGASLHNFTRKQKVGRATYNRYIDELGVEGRAKRFGESDIQWKRIVDIESLDETRSVYDLDVRLNDNFVANGVFVHNSNTVSVVIEELLEAGFPTMIVDTDGEYYGLKEEYELLHAGADEECDVQIEPEHAERMATLALEENVPIILDVSGYLDADAASDLIRETARHLFAKEKKLKKPFLLVVEEVHEYIPEGGGLDDTGRMLIQIGKRGRKHGLGIVGISQRPADVKKDFITQANWLVWHRLTWENDTKVVGRILGNEYEQRVSDLQNGRAFVQTDWAEADVQEVQFREKRTFDAGATPGLEDFERPDLKSVSNDLVADLEEISDRRDDERERIASLERDLQEREARIEDLEEELSAARDVGEAARQMAAALTGDVDLDRSALEERVMEKDREISELRGQVSDLEAERDRLQRRVDSLESELDRPGETELDTFAEYEERIADLEAELTDREQRIADLEADLEDREADLVAAETAVREREDEIDRLRGRLDAATATDDDAATATDDDAATATADAAVGRADDAAETPPDPDEAATADGDADAAATAPTDESTQSDESTPSADPAPTQTAPGDPVEIETDPDDDAVLLEDGPADAGDAERSADGTADDTATNAEAAATDVAASDPATDVAADENAEILTDDGPEADADQETVAAAVQRVDEDEDEDDDEGVELIEDDEPESPTVPDDATLVDMVLADPVTERVLMAYREARCNERHTWQVVSALATAAPLSVAELHAHTDAGEGNVRDLLTELRRLSLVVRHDDATYELDRETIERLIENPTHVDGFDDPEYVQRLD